MFQHIMQSLLETVRAEKGEQTTHINTFGFRRNAVNFKGLNQGAKYGLLGVRDPLIDPPKT